MPAVKCEFLCELFFVFLASVKGHGVQSEQRPRYQGYIFVFRFLVDLLSDMNSFSQDLFRLL